LYYAKVKGDDAVKLLDGDMFALRFLALRQLAEARLVPAEEAETRIIANRGALLPLTEQAPAAGLDRSIPSLPQIMQIAKLMNPGSNSLTLLMDSLLPANPTARMALLPQTKEAARMVLERLNRLEATGLISDEQRSRETEALYALINSTRLAETDQVPPPPPPAPAKPKGHGAGSGMGHRGSTPLYVPDPTNFEAPKLDPKTTSQAGLYLMQIPDPSQAEKAWNMLKTQSPELAKLGVVLVRTDLGDVGLTWRVVAGPVTVEEARSICEGVRTKNQDCTPIPYPKNGTPPPPPKLAPAPVATVPTATTPAPTVSPPPLAAPAPIATPAPAVEHAAPAAAAPAMTEHSATPAEHGAEPHASPAAEK
jgi:hypothetical protein